ncbi:MAG: hypothetical protein ACM3ST_12880 [Bdellovibrio bacteriovorus]
MFPALVPQPGKALEGREVAVFDAATEALVTQLTAASTGMAHAYNAPDGRHTMMTNCGKNLVTIVDLEGLKPVKDLRMGRGGMGQRPSRRTGASPMSPTMGVATS